MLLSKRLELFKRSGIYHPALSYQALVHGILKDKVNPSKPKIITFRSNKGFNAEKFNEHVSTAPWQVGEIFDEVDDFWNTMMKNTVDEHMPVKKRRVRDKDVPTAQWHK